MAYWEWAPDSAQANAPLVVCLHGVSRQGRDFDSLARDLSSHCRVICPDVVGRGQSERLADPAGYVVPTYVADMVALSAHLQARWPVQQWDLVGTSMGGLIGMGWASLAGSPIRRLVINDVGPRLEAAAVQRIGAYLGQPVVWPSVEVAAAALRELSLGFGPHSTEEWLALTRPQLVPAPGGGLMSHYDPAIGAALRSITPELAASSEALLWQVYDSLRCRTLLLRGAQSDLLSPDTARAMSQRGPKASLVEFAGVGHAPTLVAADQRRVVREFLLGD
jgi:pimeloyl-ACP methyl ester carboxylesterase